MVSTEALTESLDVAGQSIALRFGRRGGAEQVRTLEAVSSALGSDAGTQLVRRSPVVPLAGGALLRLDDLPDSDADRDHLRRVIERAVEAEGGTVDDLVGVPIDGLADLDACPKAVVLRLFPPPRGARSILPGTWIDLAGEWVFGDLPAGAPIRMRVLGVEVMVSPREAAATLARCAAARAWCDVVSGDVTTRIRTASLSFGIAPHVAIGAGGPRCDNRGLVARFELLEDVARMHATGSYACIDIEPTFELLGLGFAASEWAAQDGASANRVAGLLIDRYVPDAFPVQILGPQHAEALDDPRGLVPLGNGHFQFSIGAPEGWLPDAPTRHDLQDRGWEALSPLLLRAEELEDAIAGRADDRDDEPPATGGPDLETIVLTAHAHDRRGAELTVLELTAWLAGDAHSDAPSSVSPVVRTLAREVGAGLDDTRRQALIPIAKSLIGTSPTSEETETARCWMIADRLLRVHTPAFLRLAGLAESASRLGELGPATDDGALVRGVDLVGRSISTASRRLQTALDLARHRADEVDAVAWDVWEELAPRSGWAAAAHTVTMGVPGDLTFTTDQRVMELSRDAEQRTSLERSRRSLGDEVWSAALTEVARMAWSSAWNKAERILERESRFSFQPTLRRTMIGALNDPRGVTVDMILDEVDAAARDKIARLILVGDTASDYWNKGVEAASAVDGGNYWRQAFEDTRDLLGATLFDEATGAAQTELAGWAAQSAKLVARAVVASVTREACSVAGRGVAARLAAEVLTRGGSAEAAAARAVEHAEPVVSALAHNSVKLVADVAALR